MMCSLRPLAKLSAVCSALPPRSTYASMISWLDSEIDVPAEFGAAQDQQFIAFFFVLFLGSVGLALRRGFTLRQPPRAASTGYSSIMLGARAAGTPTPRRREARTRMSATSSAPAYARVDQRYIRAHLLERPVKAGPCRIGQHAFDYDLRSGNDQRRGGEERRRARVARYDHLAPGELGVALDRNRLAGAVGLDADSGPEVAQHPLGVVARSAR